MDANRQHDSMRLLRSLVAITRRGLADARDEDTRLSMTEQSIMMAIAEQPGIRSTDIARMFRLNRSTVSRQLAALIRLGLVRETPSDTGRGRPLELTEDGASAFQRALASLQRIVEAHLATWSDDEIARFAHDLERFDRAADAS